MFDEILNVCKGKGKVVRILQDASPGASDRRYTGALLPGPRGREGDNPAAFDMFDWLVRDKNILMGFKTSEVREVTVIKYGDTGEMRVDIVVRQTTLR